MARTRTPAPTSESGAVAAEEADALFDLGLELPEDEEGWEEEAPPVRSLGDNAAEISNEVLMSFPEDKHPTDLSKFKRMIWMAMKRGAFTAIVDEGNGESRGIVKVKTEPFCLTPPIHPHFHALFARSYVPKAPNGSNGALRVPKWQRLWEYPPSEAMLPKRNRAGQIIPKKDADGRTVLGVDGKPVPVLEMQSDCRGMAAYPDKVEGKATGHMIKTCPLANCPSHPRPEGIYHSVWMAQTFISQIKRVDAIRRYIRDYDPRPDVVNFAQRVIERRTAMEERERGLGDSTISLNY